MRRKRILICDDQERFIEQFKANHQTHYDITQVSNIGAVISQIHDMKPLPDLVLLDLYHPREGKSPTFHERQQKAEEELAKLNDQIYKTKEAVDKTWCPQGLKVLEDIRREYSARRLPVVIYSQRGLFLLDDDQVRAVEECDGHWLIKKQFEPATERIRMDRIMNYAGQARPILKFYRMMLAVTWAILIFLMAVNYLPLAFAIRALAGIGMGIVSSTLAFFLTRAYENRR